MNSDEKIIEALRNVISNSSDNTQKQENNNAPVEVEGVNVNQSNETNKPKRQIRHKNNNGAKQKKLI